MPRGKGLLGYAVTEELIPLEGSTAKAFYECCQCGLCEEWCSTHYNLPGAILAARADAVEKGSQPEVVKETAQRVLENNSLYETGDQSRTGQFAEKAPVGLEMASVVLFMGCGAAYADHASADATFQVLNQSEVGYTLLTDEKCCGAPLYSLGYQKEALALAQANFESLRQAGCKALVSPCPECVKSFKIDHPQWGLEETRGFEVFHISEFVLNLVDKGTLKLTKPVDMLVAYHDNCHMSRGLGICDQPRDLLKRVQGMQVAELEYIHSHSHCCGAGGGIQFVNPETAKTASRKIIEEAQSLGVAAIVTASVNCKHHMQSAMVPEDTIEVLHIMEVVAKAL
jgi:heterodisulfide reductase subunit D|tara:strand:+ start:991 stop:2013 length:1023 start_codon:yes stop_codon:yes gene_type:complete